MRLSVPVPAWFRRYWDTNANLTIQNVQILFHRDV